MKKQMRLNALDMNCVGCCPGLWLHPEDQTLRYNTLEYWTEVAQVLERGLFDSLFIADIYGIYDVYGGNADAAFRNAVEFPVNDPLLLVPAMALVTKHLSFGITGTVTYEPPYSFARRFSTLDHLTNGRVAWNIVTGYLESAAKAFGQHEQLRHDDRYALAGEYMEVVYKLWEGSWEDDAVLRDKVNGIFARPEKIHKVFHEGKYFRMEAYHICEPSPQRTPVLFQAGASTKGRQFAAQHAECLFISGPTRKIVAEIVSDIRKRAAELGRNPKSLIIFTGLGVITGPTDAEAHAKLADYRRHVSVEGLLALFGGYMGIDFAGYDLDQPLEYVEINAIQTFMEEFTRADPTRQWTLRQIAEYLGTGRTTVVGSPSTVADELIEWMEETGVDGFNLDYLVSPGDMIAFVDLVVPELQRRGVYKTSYEEGTFREKLYGKGRNYLPDDHPGASYRYGRSKLASSTVSTD
ncbi:MAG TPA: LLM class flavin-dependent oxidoreductase [Blastocatellia bacterium]|nr:LLM class flavin-dependent oxidoreductase [Blastocatellia bacterium]